MLFRTIFQIPISRYKITHNTKIFTIGSCFSDEIGKKFSDLKFDVSVNPFGVMFNTYSISNIILRSLHKRYYTYDDIQKNRGQYFCFDLHSSFNKTNVQEVLDGVNKKIDDVSSSLSCSDVLIITLGTSWVYKIKNGGSIVANCHKVSSKKFDKVLLSTEDNFNYLNSLIFDLKNYNPNLKIIITISPVRHIKDGFRENNISKSRLIDSIYLLEHLHDYIDYFPSYELLIDDLRDYRFYKKDMVHPTEQAIDYVWGRFSDVYFSEDTLKINKTIEKIRLALDHRPFDQKSNDYQLFLKKIMDRIYALQRVNNISFLEEIKDLKLRIKNVS